MALRVNLRTWLFTLVVLCACDQSDCQTMPPSVKDDCTEFNYNTARGGRPVVCRILWCNKGGGEYHQGSGLATLWCDGEAPAAAGSQP